ncbi:response regulator [Halosimplex rubrum]|uniref:histidine kinase n=1 Tax=Halosimplex rubrum TaxID=869889 RepID=A0A7D5T1H7_9EURY|nr:ATP-binding protein [Halosimplex rubrum]QLH78928.1 response regulator [Halosimplex rubrum]
MTDGRPTSTTYVRPLEETSQTVSVLCVHPDEATVAAVTDGLEAASESVTAHGTTAASDAFDRLEVGDVDCLVCAYSLPDTDGLAVLERVRETHDRLPFVMLTGDGSERVAAAAINAGADGYVTYDGEPEQETFAALDDRIATVVDDYRARERLEDTTELLFRLTEYTNDALWMFTGDWSETVVINSAYEPLWDRPIADLIEDPGDFLRGVHPDDRETVAEKMAVLSDGEAADLEFRVDTSEERIARWVSVHAEPVFDDDGSVKYVAGFTRDITELKRREERLTDLAEATRRLPQARTETEVTEIVVATVDTVVGRSVTGYWTYDDEADRLVPSEFSDGALDRAGVSGPDALPVLGPDHDWMDRFRAGTPSVLPESDGSSSPPLAGIDPTALVLVPVGDHGVLVVGDPGTAVDEFERSMVEMIEQTTVDALDRVSRERELERQRTELKRSNESLQQFAYVASHDLQEPLRMVSSYVSLLEEEYGDSFDEDGELYMEYAVDGATRMQAMIDALLQYSRVTTKGDEPTETDSEAVFDETVRSLEMLIDDSDAAVDRGDLPPVVVDRNQLGQLFQNLVENALHYGGEEPTVTVGADHEDGRVHFTVADDGPGVDTDQQDRIFEIFKQNSTRPGSTGIGLAMCRRIVNRHGGEIWVESEPDDGATFHFTMPAVDEADQETDA